MKIKVRKLFACILSLVLSMSLLTSCKAVNGDSSTSGDLPLKPISPTVENAYVVNNGKSDYKIIVADVATLYTQFAVSEFNTFFEKATSFELEILSDNQIDFDTSAKYISIGENDFQAQAGVVCNESITDDGYTIKTVGNSVFVVGNTDVGTLYGTYELLRNLIDWECYGVDVYWYETNVSRIPLYDFDVKASPDFGIRTCRHPSILDSNETLMRMNFEMSRTSLRINGAAGHTSMYYVPIETHYENHPKWYSTKKQQLCYTAHGDKEEYKALIEACRDTIIKEMKEDLLSTWVNFTMADNNDWCDCEACDANWLKYGADSASVIIFLNDLMDSVYDWFETEEAKPYVRDLNLQFMAYLQLENAPVKYDESTNSYVAIDDLVRCNEHVIPKLCLTVASYTQDITAEQNKTALTNLQSWAAVSPQLQAYLYCANYVNYLVPHNTPEAIQSWYQAYKKYGTTAVENLGKNLETGLSTGWYNLQMYLDSKLGWDVNADVGVLVDEFFNATYRNASDTMKLLYNEYKVHNKYNESLDPQYIYTFIMTGSNVMNVKYWPKQILDRWNGYIDKALDEIAPLKETNAELYETVYKYIVCERVWINYLRYTYHNASYYGEELSELKDEIVRDINVCGITRFSEAELIAGFLDTVN